MPVIAVKKIERGLKGSNPSELALRIPDAIIQGIHLIDSDVFICEFKKHFNSEQNLIKEINETAEVPYSYDSYNEKYYPSVPLITILTGLDVTKKYGFLVDEYLEIIFKEIKGERREKSILIFPERTVEDLDFIPKEK